MGTEQNCCRKQPVVLGSDRFWLLELRVSRTFLDQLQPQLFRPWIPNSRRCLHFCPRSGRFRLYELRVSRTFLNFLRLVSFSREGEAPAEPVRNLGEMKRLGRSLALPNPVKMRE